MADKDFETFFETVLEKIKEKRKEKGLTQGQLGELIEKPQSAVARFESGGVKDPGISMIFIICRALGISPGEVLDPVFAEYKAENSDEKTLGSDLTRLMKQIDQLPPAKRAKIQKSFSEILSLI